MDSSVGVLMDCGADGWTIPMFVGMFVPIFPKQWRKCTQVTTRQKIQRRIQMEMRGRADENIRKKVS